MPRRNRDRQDRLGQVLTQVHRRFDNSPLAVVGDLLTRNIAELQVSAGAGFTPPDSVERFAAYTLTVLDSLPRSFGDRFTFDAQLIAALAEEWSQGTARLSHMLIPKPSQTWGHQTVWMPSTDRKTAHVVDVIHLPGDETIDDIDLLDYPFVCHEMGHNVLFKHGEAFCTSFNQGLDTVVHGLQRQTLALHGTAKQVASDTVEQMRRYWTPSADHYNWGHEIAVDVISVWTCGPAYLAALHDVMESSDLNPYQLGQSHPPYEVRAKAMIVAANQLGWAYYTGETQGLIDGWPRTAWAKDKTNLYAACADSRVVQQAVATTLETCRSLALPLCTPKVIEAVRRKLEEQALPDLGVEILVAAWTKHSQVAQEGYDEWQQDVIRRHLVDLTP